MGPGYAFMQDGGNNSLEASYRKATAGVDHPTLIVVDAKSEYGQYVLDNRDGETEFDGWQHAYVKRGDQTFMVPLSELIVED